jgi:hypothetical protein
MKRTAATILREYGPFPDVTNVHGVSYDGTNIWIATGDTLNAIDPASGKTVRALDVPAHAGTAFDGQHLFQISGDRIQKVDPKTGRVIGSVPTPDGGASGMAWAEGSLWVGQQPQDPSSRSTDWRDPSHHRVEPLRYRRHLGGRRAVARHLGSREKRTAQNRSAERRGSGTARHAGGHCRIGARVERQRHLLLRRRQQRQGARGQTAASGLRPYSHSMVPGGLLVTS